MKQIRLINLTLRGWRGAENLTLNFGGESALISGRNASGKSRVMDAFLWLLFGKDSQDRKDYELRTRTADGKVQHHTECSVQGTLSVDGEIITLRREYKEQWVRPRGQQEEVFKGNVTECSWNDVPVRVGDFQKRVNAEIIDDTLFRLITNPAYFFSIKWQQQRDMLLSMAGTRTDEEIAAGNHDFNVLLDTLSGRSLTDYRREVAARIKRIKAEMADVPARIEQTHAMFPEEEDWKEIEKRMAALANERTSLQDQLAKASTRLSDARKKENALQEEMDSIKAEMKRVVKQAEQQAQAEADAANEQRRIIEAELKRATSLNAENNIDLRHNEERIAELTKRREELQQRLDALRQQWHEIKGRSIEVNDTCPVCGQPLPPEMVAEARERAEEEKRTLIEANNREGKAAAQSLEETNKEIAQKERALQVNRQREQEYSTFIEGHYQNLREYPAVQPKAVNQEELPEWQQLNQRLAELGKQKFSLQGDDDDNEQIGRIKQRLAELAEEEKMLAVRLSKRELIAKCEAELLRLRDRERELAQMLADAERSEYIAAQFCRARIADCETRINNMFRSVRFRLFDTTQDGSEYECCTPSVDGIPYGSLNTASQINAGMDVIATLCRYNNVQAPIFCDNAESVNNVLSPDGAQLIRLQVTNDNFKVSTL